MKNLIVMVLALTSLHASADRFEIGKGVKTVKITKATTDVEVKFAIPLYKIEERLVVERVTCRLPSCSTEIGDGSDGKWHNFFSVKESEKPAALAAAVKGIGPSIAAKIVEFDLFNHKPDSWSQFKALITKIERQLTARGLNYKFATQVIEQYGYDNMISLGYGNEQSCRYVESVCDQVTLKEFKTLSHYIDRHLSVVVKNQSLQSFEADSVEITAGTEKNDVAVSVNGHNSYVPTLLSRGTILELDGTRVLRPFPINEVVTTFAKNGQNNFEVSLTVPEKFLAEDKDSEIHATIELCRADWFGGCFSVVGNAAGKLVKGKYATAFVTTNLRKGSLYFVKFRLNKTNSEFYSSAKSGMDYTVKVKN